MAQPNKDIMKWGVFLPGLGHLLRGDFVNAAGLFAYVGLLLWALVSGGPRLGTVFVDASAGNALLWHPVFAALAFFLLAYGTWMTAYRAWRSKSYDADKDYNSQWRELRLQFRKNRVGLLGLHAVLFLIFLAFLTPFLTPHHPNALDVGGKILAPSWVYLMGTDEFGRDIFSRVMYGARISLSIGFIAVGISVTLGTLIGATAGYYGGWVDRLAMWFVDLLLSLPRLVLLLAIVGFFRAAGAQSLFLIVFVLGLTGWMGVSRIVRSSVLSLKEQDFIQACRALGLPQWRIILVHLVPNALAPVIVNASLAIGSTILVEASLSFLGLGVPPPTATWGAIVNDGREFLRSAPWITIAPGLMIVLAVMSFNLLGDGLRDALDPKLRGRS